MAKEQETIRKIRKASAEFSWSCKPMTALFHYAYGNGGYGGGDYGQGYGGGYYGDGYYGNGRYWGAYAAGAATGTAVGAAAASNNGSTTTNYYNTSPSYYTCWDAYNRRYYSSSVSCSQ